MDWSMPIFSFLHYLPGFSQTHVCWWWYHPTILSSVTHFSSCSQSFPASGSFPISRLFVSGGQTIGASASVLPMNIQGWFPLGLTGLISLLSKGLSRVFSSSSVIFFKTKYFEITRNTVFKKTLIICSCLLDFCPCWATKTNSEFNCMFRLIWDFKVWPHFHILLFIKAASLFRVIDFKIKYHFLICWCNAKGFFWK